MSKSSQTPLFSADLHEMGTRLVDLLNQTGFLYRFPGVSGVTLACISQHIEPLEELLRKWESRRTALGKSLSPDGYTVARVNRADPAEAAYDYAKTGYRAFMNGLRAAATGIPAESDRAAVIALCDARPAPSAQDVLAVREAIDAVGEKAVGEASRAFHAISDDDWQGLRMVLFFFLLELEKLNKSFKG